MYIIHDLHKKSQQKNPVNLKILSKTLFWGQKRWKKVKNFSIILDTGRLELPSFGEVLIVDRYFQKRFIYLLTIDGEVAYNKVMRATEFLAVKGAENTWQKPIIKKVHFFCLRLIDLFRFILLFKALYYSVSVGCCGGICDWGPEPIIHASRNLSSK